MKIKKAISLLFALAAIALTAYELMGVLRRDNRNTETAEVKA